MMTAYRICSRFAASALLVSWLAIPALAQHGGHAGGGAGGGGAMAGHSGGMAGPSAASRPAGHGAATPSNRPAPRATSSPKVAAPASTSSTSYTPASGMHLVPGVPSNGPMQAAPARGAVSPATNRQYFSAATGTSVGTVHSFAVPGRYPIYGGGGYFPYGYGGYGFGGFGYGGYGFGYGFYPYSLWNLGWGSGFGFGYGMGYGFGYGYGSGFGYGPGFGLGYYDNGLGYGSSSANTQSSGDYGPFATLDAKTNQPGALPDPAQESTLVLKDGTSYTVTDYWMADGKLHFVTAENGESIVDIEQVDLQGTVEQNSKRGVTFTLRNQDAAQPAQAPAGAPPSAPAQAPASAPQP